MNASIQIISTVILCSAPIVGFLIFFVINEIESNEYTRQFKKSMEQLDRCLEEPFSVADYYDRMMKVSEDLARQKAERKYEPTVLWLLLDGLRINGDGTLEWVHKKKPKKDICIPPTPPKSILYANNIPIYKIGIENCSIEDRLRMQYSQLQFSIASQMAEIQNQVQSQALAAAMTKCNPIYNMRPAGSELRKWGDDYGEPYYSWAQEL